MGRLFIGALLYCELQVPQDLLGVIAGVGALREPLVVDNWPSQQQSTGAGSERGAGTSEPPGAAELPGDWCVVQQVQVLLECRSHCSKAGRRPQGATGSRCWSRNSFRLSCNRLQVAKLS